MMVNDSKALLNPHRYQLIFHGSLSTLQETHLNQEVRYDDC